MKRLLDNRTIANQLGRDAEYTFDGPCSDVGDRMEWSTQGADEDTGDVYEKLFPWIEIAGLQIEGDSWDACPNDPTETPEEELVTEIYVPVKMPR